MPRPAKRRPARELFGEKDFYLEEFRGRSVLIAVAPAAAGARVNLRPLASAITDLVRNGTRVLLWWPAVGAPSERRLLVALARARRRQRRRGKRGPVRCLRLEAGALTGPAAERLRGTLWSVLRHERLCVLVVHEAVSFPRPA